MGCKSLAKNRQSRVRSHDGRSAGKRAAPATPSTCAGLRKCAYGGEARAYCRGTPVLSDPRSTKLTHQYCLFGTHSTRVPAPRGRNYSRDGDTAPPCSYGGVYLFLVV